MTGYGIERAPLASLNRDEALDPAAKQALDRIIQVAQRLFDVKMVTISLVESERVWFKAQIGNDPSGLSVSDDICVETANGRDVLVVADASNDPRFADCPAPAQLRFYAGAPLIDTEGICIGALCIGDARPHWDFGTHEADNWREMAQTAVTEMEFRGIIAEQRNLLEDLTFRQELNVAIAKARDFDAALREILRRACAFLNAVYCVVPQINADGATCRFIVGVVAPTAGAEIETEIAEILMN